MGLPDEVAKPIVSTSSRNAVDGGRPVRGVVAGTLAHGSGGQMARHRAQVASRVYQQRFAKHR